MEYTAEEIIDICECYLDGPGFRCSLHKAEANGITMDEIRAKKEEIKAILRSRKEAEEEARRKEREEHERKLAAIPGLKELSDAYADMAKWRYEFNKSFDGEGGGGVGVRPKPKYDFEAMEKKYPIAVAYRKAEAEANKANYELSEIGKRAVQAILDNPESYEEVMAQMKAEEKAFFEKHMWD